MSEKVSLNKMFPSKSSKMSTDSRQSQSSTPEKKPKLPTSVVKIVCVLTSVVFLMTTVGNLIFTVFALQLRLTRLSQINLGYQIVFLMPFIPFSFGILFENRELLVPFFIVNVYSALINVAVTVLVNIHMVDHRPLDPARISSLCICSTIVSIICGIFIVMLYGRFTKILQDKQNKHDSEFKINSYSLQRYGDIVRE